MTTAVSRPGLHPPRQPDEEDDENRYYNRVAFASTDYCPWFIGKLRLGRANLDRMRTSGVPVLRSHEGDNVVGAVTRVDKENDLWRSNWRLPKIPANRDTFDQMDSGIMRGISVGGSLDWNSITVDNEDEVDSYDDLLLTADNWTLVEESLTPIPLDVRAGVDRDASATLRRNKGAFDTLIGLDGISTLESLELREHIGNLMRQHNVNVNRKVATMTTAPTITDDAIERALASHLEKSQTLKRLAEMPGQIDKLLETDEQREKEMMDLGHKLNTIQFQPGGAVLQMSNWSPLNAPLNVGRILRLTADKELGFPALDPQEITMEESFLEMHRDTLMPMDRSALARVPFEAIMERSRQRAVQRSAMADAAGARPAQVNIVGDAGLLFNSYAPVLAAMEMRMGLRGSQKVPYFTAQGSAAGGAEDADIPISTYTMQEQDMLPVSIASAFDLSSSLQAVDNTTFEALVDYAIFTVCQDEMTKQVIDGGGSTANEIAGLWGRVVAGHQHSYGAAQSDFTRTDVLTVKNHVDLAKTDGGPGSFILSSTLYQLAELTLRGGASSERYLLEDMMMESRMAHHFADFVPTGVIDAGLYAKLDRCVLLIWGDSFMLTEIPVRARKSEYKMTVEANLAVVQPNQNLARIQQT